MGGFLSMNKSASVYQFYIPGYQKKMGENARAGKSPSRLERRLRISD
jgi:hypothetical protein